MNMVNEMIYVFKIALKRNKKRLRRIKIKGSQTLSDFDGIIRDAFNHDRGDHLSAFYRGSVWQSESWGDIDPDGKGSGANKQVEDLGLVVGDKIEYVYDFGDDVQYVITLENIIEPVKDVKYPCITSHNSPDYNKREVSEKQGNTTLDLYIFNDREN